MNLEEIETPVTGKREVLVEVKSSAVCATDLRVISSGHRSIQEGEKRILGHEISGVIKRAGSDVAHLKPGEPVTIAPIAGCGFCGKCISGKAALCENNQVIGLSIDGGFAEYLKIPEKHVFGGNVFKIPDSLPFNIAAMTEPLATVFTGLEACNVKPADVVLIIGAGPIGLMHTLMAKVFGAKKIIVSEISAPRRARALDFGADCIIDPLNEDIDKKVKQLSFGEGADAVIIAASSQEAQIQSLDLVRPGGYINFFGTLKKGSENIKINSNLIHYKNIKLLGTTGTSVLNFYKTLELLISGKINITGLVTAEFLIADFDKAFDFAAKPDCLKIFFNFSR